MLGDGELSGGVAQVALHRDRDRLMLLMECNELAQHMIAFSCGGMIRR